MVQRLRKLLDGVLLWLPVAVARVKFGGPVLWDGD
jgi:hypothetical protein